MGSTKKCCIFLIKDFYGLLCLNNQKKSISSNKYCVVGHGWFNGYIVSKIRNNLKQKHEVENNSDMLVNMLQYYIWNISTFLFFALSLFLGLWSPSCYFYWFHSIIITVTYSTCNCICLLWQLWHCSLYKNRTKISRACFQIRFFSEQIIFVLTYTVLVY